MKAKERNKLWDLYAITNKMGGRADYTAISPIAMMKYNKELRDRVRNENKSI